MRIFFRYYVLLFTQLIPIISCNSLLKDRHPSRPNIILILADDMGWSDLGSYGSEINTPHLDRLAENGIRFTHMYNTSKCCPSRACLLTGLYARQVGYDRDYQGPLEHAVTLGEALRMAGYRTLWSGKHHGMENPVYRGFDHYYGLKEGASNHFNPGVQREGEGTPAQKRPDRPWCFDSLEVAPFSPEQRDYYSTDYFTRWALEWLDRYREEERPFFLYLSYTVPHDPLMAWPEDINQYLGFYREGYEVIRQRRFERQKQLGLVAAEAQLPEAQHRPWGSLPEDEQLTEDSTMAVYAAMVGRLDQNIGNLVSKLEEIGKAANTLILFASDNGASAEVVRLKDYGPIGSLTRWKSQGSDWANVSNTPLRYYKNYSYEGGICSPLIAWWPDGIRHQGTIDSQPLHFVDFMPTFLELARGEYPSEYEGRPILPVEGISFAPALAGETVERTNPLYFEWNRGRTIRAGDWKAVVWDNRDWELYHLGTDPYEQSDLAVRHPDLVDSLNTLHDRWKQRAEAQKANLKP